MNKSEELQPQVQEIRSRISDTIQSAKNSIADAESAAVDALRNAASSADDYVRENPWVAIGVIAGVAASLGFLAGYMTAPRKSFMGMLRR